MDQDSRDVWNSPAPGEGTVPEFVPVVPRRFEINARHLAIFFLLLSGTIFTTWLVGGPLFCLGLLLILGTHEFGHYWACRRNNVDATLPNFIPAPPMFIAGTFGAFIAIKEPIPDRRSLMEIGAAGPIAGFLMAVPVMVIGLMLSTVTFGPLVYLGGASVGSSISVFVLTKLVLGVNPMDPNVTIYYHPVAFAGWLGLFFTALNLLPLSQLDGGHVMYSLLEGKYGILFRIFFVAILPLGFFWMGWFVLAALVMLAGLKHPPVLREDIKLEPIHKKLGYVCIIIFVITFVPVPFGLIQ